MWLPIQSEVLLRNYFWKHIHSNGGKDWSACEAIFITLFERAFKMMKNGIYFIVIALLLAELFKILIYAN